MSGEGATLIFRSARAEDAESVAALVNSAYRGDSSRRGWTTEADLLGGQRTDAAMIRELIETQGSRIELAEWQDGGLVGSVHLRREAPEICYLGMLTIDPAQQAAGLGRRLIDHSESVARSWGCARMRMTVIHLREELLQYYERRGYQRSGVILPFPAGDPRFGLPRVELKLLELVKPLG